MGGWEPASHLAEAAEGLRGLANDLDAGMGPRRGQGLRRIGGMRVVPLVVHDALCGWRVASRQGTDPEVLGCAGCGLGWLAGEIR